MVLFKDIKKEDILAKRRIVRSMNGNQDVEQG